MQTKGRAGDVSEVILGSTGILAVFRIGPTDAGLLVAWLGLAVYDLRLLRFLRIQNRTVITRWLRAGEPMPTMAYCPSMRQ